MWFVKKKKNRVIRLISRLALFRAVNRPIYTHIIVPTTSNTLKKEEKKKR